MSETLEQTIKRLKFCRDCTNKYYEVGRLEYERLDKMIEELEEQLKKQKEEEETS